MIDMTDAELRDLGWRWALRDSAGALLAVTTCPEDVSSWDDRDPHKRNRIVPLRHLREAK